MKKTGLEIVEMIAKGEAPKKIKHKWEDWEIIYTYNKATNSYEYDSPDDLDLIQFLNDEFEIIEEESKIWKPKDGEEYYVINAESEIEKRYWNNDEYDIGSYQMGNCFKTKEEAEKEKEKIIIKKKLERYAEEHNTEKIDWDNPKQSKYHIEIYNNNKINIWESNRVKHMNQVYFTSGEICKEAIEEIGEENIKKLFEE